MKADVNYIEAALHSHIEHVAWLHHGVKPVPRRRNTRLTSQSWKSFVTGHNVRMAERGRK